MKWGIFVYTSSKTEERTRWIKNTWGKNVENLFFFTDKSYPEDNFIQVTDDTEYESNVEKNLKAIKYAYDENYDWSFFIGDDVYVFVDTLLRYINTRTPNSNDVYGEILRKTWPKDRTLSYLCGGGGILFSKSSIEKFINQMEHQLNLDDAESYRSYKYADVVIGLIMKESGMKMVNVSQLIKGNSPSYYGIKHPEQYISFHFINTKEKFQNLWERDNEKN